MSRKDFELIARTISDLSPRSRVEAAAAFALALQAINPRFDKERFIDACTPKA